MMMQLDSSRPAASLVWKRKGRSERAEDTDSLQALITTPVFEDGLIFGVCSYGQFRCLDAASGDRIWESLDLIELGRWATAFLVRNGDRYFINNDLGDLIIARFDEKGDAGLLDWQAYIWTGEDFSPLQDQAASGGSRR